MAIPHLLKTALIPKLQETRQQAHDLNNEIVVVFVEEAMAITPVRTGRLRDSWAVGFGVASLRSMRRPADPIKEIRAKLRGRRLGMAVTVQNRAPYASAVNNGVAGRFPGRFMVERTKRKMGYIIETAKRRVGILP